MSFGQPTDLTMHVFDKLDGSNIRAEWSKKRGFYKFGTRHHLLGADDPMLGPSIELITKKYGDDLSHRFKELKYESAVAFFEYIGPRSQFGHHLIDDPHDVVLIDVNPYKIGILDPDRFVASFGDLDIPKVLHVGPIDQTFIDSVYADELAGITFEGVVCKGKAARNTDVPVMFKLKTKKWLDALRARCGSDQKLFDTLK